MKPPGTFNGRNRQQIPSKNAPKTKGSSQSDGDGGGVPSFVASGSRQQQVITLCRYSYISYHLPLKYYRFPTTTTNTTNNNDNNNNKSRHSLSSEMAIQYCFRPFDPPVPVLNQSTSTFIFLFVN